MKKVWITALEKDEEQVGKLMQTLKTYGLDAAGHFWTDDLQHMAWSTPTEELARPETALWMIFGSMESLTQPTIAFGLSLLAMQVYARKGQAFPLVILLKEGNEAPKLPTLLSGAEVFPANLPGLGAKMVTMANMPAKRIVKDYFLDIHAIPGIGLWLAVGPAPGSEWKGALVGVHGGDIDFHAVGPRKGLPEQSTLEYPSKGLKIQMGDDEFIAWGVQNSINDATSYLVRLTGTPDRILFGPFPGDDNPEMNIITLS